MHRHSLQQMTAASTNIHSEKPAPVLPAMGQFLPEPGIANRYHNGYLRIKCHKLELAQITVGLIALVLTQPNHLDGQTGFGYVFQFITFHLPLLTAIALWDNLNGKRLATVLRLEPVWNRCELYFNFAAAALYYVGSFAVLVTSIGHYNPRTNILAGIAGMLACLGHGYQWWLLFREDVLKRDIEEMIREAVGNERASGGVVNV